MGEYLRRVARRLQQERFSGERPVQARKMFALR
jgi:hypothetical protein